MLLYSLLFFFFFQAEDGIRDYKVTGVQTCALPISSNREMALAMGVDIPRLFTLLFGVGAGLCAVAGALLGPLFAVQVGMGENILILAFVVIVIGGIGSIRGALVGSLLVGVVDTIGRAFLPLLLGIFFQPRVASAAGPAIASVLVYLLMAVVLYIKPHGPFPARGL